MASVLRLASTFTLSTGAKASRVGAPLPPQSGGLVCAGEEAEHRGEQPQHCRNNPVRSEREHRAHGASNEQQLNECLAETIGAQHRSGSCLLYTSFRRLAAIERPTSGSIVVDGQNLGALRRSAIPYLRRNIGLILSLIHIFTVRKAIEIVSLSILSMTGCDRVHTWRLRQGLRVEFGDRQTLITEILLCHRLDLLCAHG